MSFPFAWVEHYREETGKTMEHNETRVTDNFLSLRRNSTVQKCVKLVNFSQQFQREKSRMTELVMKCKESGRVSHTSGGTDVQTRGLVSQRCTGVLWLGSLDLQQGGLPRVTAWDVALGTAWTEVSSEPCSSSTCQSLNPTSDSRSMCVHLVAFSPTEGLGWGFQGWEHWLCKLPWVSFRCPHCQ